ncbi:fimbrillin family protein [Prevotella sp. P4-98]|uniref:fimbrillin family protein n=1 Tax=Prevotella sp. P4-98 TaxID=2024219 RepID=UPI00117CFAF6|nr:fimbrillin family protein [Prevotella sp. P4-98]
MKSVLAIAGILALASCSSSEDFFTENLGDNNKSVKMTFTASQENGSATRTAIGTEGGKTKIHWSESDVIKVTNGTETNDFTLTAGQGTTKATFNGEISESATYYAIYPNQDGVSFSGNKFSGVQLKATQEAKEGSFDPKAAIMVAKSNGTNLPFKNVVAYFKVTPTFDCSEIVVTAHKSTDALAGTFDVAIDGEGTPSISITNGSREVKLTGTITANKDYYILLLPGTFENGFSVTLKPKDDNTKKYFKQKNSSFTLNRNDLWNLGKMEGATEVSESTIPYITFTADEEQTFKYYNYSYQVNTGVASDANKYLEYSVNGGEWKNFNDVLSVSFGGGNGDLRLRAKVDQGKYVVSDAGPMFKFGNETVKVNCTGDIRTLIDYENYYCANTSKAMFMNFFNSMTNLKSAPDLPSMELASQCYYAMFKGCTGLTTAPELPATTLANSCYYEMFNGCTGLTTAPKLPATTLDTFCYREMFYGCTSLTTAPELPATTLAMGCYDKMFYDCSNLSKVTMLATKYSTNWCLDNWLDNAGTSAQSRTLKLASQTVYNGLMNKGYLPEQWQLGQATIEYNNQ